MADPNTNTKKLAAEKAVEYVQNGMNIGLGTGSTAYWAIQSIGSRVKQGLEVKAVATSGQSELLARELGIQVVTFAAIDHLDVTIDGADEIDEKLNLIKGGGGALLREKIVGSATRLYIIIADESKLVSQLGSFPLPVEVVQFGWELTLKQLQKLGGSPKIRLTDNKPFITDNGNYIIDCSFGTIPQPHLLHQQINSIPGAVENGLFLHMANIAILGNSDGTTTMIKGLQDDQDL